jgi:hypothetical protein
MKASIMCWARRWQRRSPNAWPSDRTRCSFPCCRSGALVRRQRACDRVILRFPVSTG